MSARAAGTVIAGLVFVVALVVGFWPHTIPLDYTAPDGTETVSCGSAFAADPQGAEDAALGRHIRGALGGELTASSQEYEARCADGLRAPRIIALVLAGGGLLAGVFLLLTARREPGAALGA